MPILAVKKCACQTCFGCQKSKRPQAELLALNGMCADFFINGELATPRFDWGLEVGENLAQRKYWELGCNLQLAFCIL